MEQSPEVSFSYMNKAENKISNIRPFTVCEKYENDANKIYKILLDQCKSIFSTRNKEKIHDKMFN